MGIYTKCKVILSPADNESHLLKVVTESMTLRGRLKGNLELHDSPWSKQTTDGEFEAYHLHIILYDKIKIGDVCYNCLYGKPISIFVVTEDNVSSINSEIDSFNYKIVASTNTDLNLPEPSDDFLEEFIFEYNKGNIISDVSVYFEVTYPEMINTSVDSFGNYVCHCPKCGYENSYMGASAVHCDKIVCMDLKARVNYRNQILINKSKSIYIREEVIELCKKAYWQFAKDRRIEVTSTGDVNDEFNNWVAKNL